MTTGEWEVARELPALRQWTWPFGPARSPSAFVYRALKVGDQVAGVLALCGALVIRNLDALPHGVAEFLALRITVEKFLLLAVFAVCWNRAFRWLGLYRRWRTDTPVEELARVAAAVSLGTLPTLAFRPLSITGAFTLETVALFWALAIPGVLGARWCVRALAAPLSGRRRREVLVVGSGPRAQALCRLLREPDGAAGGASLIGFVDSPDGPVDSAFLPRQLGTLAELESVLMRRVVDEVLIALPIKSCYERVQQAIHTCERLGVQSTYLADIFEPSLGRVGYEGPAFRTVKVVQDDFRLVLKRIIDLVGAAVGLVVLTPLFLVIAALIKLNDSGPVLFTQRRYGFNKRLFNMIKFRTMVPDAEARQADLEEMNEAQGPVFKIARDPRVTPLGRFLRASSLDELPQLWNVLKGEMSLVGPRPLPVRDVGHFSEGWLMRRFSMPPGLTCLWQVSGRSELSFERWVQLDLEYIDHWSLRLDARILLQTIPAVLHGRGAT
ncbi:MAG TPA: sugar transferase [Gemmatimonadales bacterium]|nr:sugar transferase [Gemmatimonadales bacterium]